MATARNKKNKRPPRPCFSPPTTHHDYITRCFVSYPGGGPDPCTANLAAALRQRYPVTAPEMSDVQAGVRSGRRHWRWRYVATLQCFNGRGASPVAATLARDGRLSLALPCSSSRVLLRRTCPLRHSGHTRYVVVCALSLSLDHSPHQTARSSSLLSQCSAAERVLRALVCATAGCTTQRGGSAGSSPAARATQSQRSA